MFKSAIGAALSMQRSPNHYWRLLARHLMDYWRLPRRLKENNYRQRGLLGPMFMI